MADIADAAQSSLKSQNAGPPPERQQSSHLDHMLKEEALLTSSTIDAPTGVPSTPAPAPAPDLPAAPPTPVPPPQTPEPMEPVQQQGEPLGDVPSHPVNVSPPDIMSALLDVTDPQVPQQASTTQQSEQHQTQQPVPSHEESSTAVPAPPPKKPGRTKAISTFLGLLFLMLITIPIGVYYLSQKQQIADNRSFAKHDPEKEKDKNKDKSKDNNKSTPTSGTPNKTQTFTLPKFPTAICPWGEGDNEASKGGIVAARVQKDVSFTVDSTCTLLGGTITTSHEPSEYLYDDTMHLLIDGKLIGGPSTLIGPLKIGDKWEWKQIVKKDQNSQKADFECIGSPCSVPFTNKSSKGDTLPLVNIGLSAENLNKVLSSGSTHTFSAIVAGDNNDTDCKLNEDLTLTLNYSCQQNLQCQYVKIYKGTTVVNPSTLVSGDVVTIAVTNPDATKARVRVNGGAFTESATKNGAGEFTVPFTVPPNIFTFTVEAELFINNTWN